MDRVYIDIIHYINLTINHIHQQMHTTGLQTVHKL